MAASLGTSDLQTLRKIIRVRSKVSSSQLPGSTYSGIWGSKEGRGGGELTPEPSKKSAQVVCSSVGNNKKKKKKNPPLKKNTQTYKLSLS